ncbi:MAG: hypothetical protein WC047_08540 [Kiritimatiellales bacterium]
MWTNAVNWAGDVLPGSGDQAAFTGVSGTTTLDAAVTVASVIAGATGGAGLNVLTGGVLNSGAMDFGGYAASKTGELQVNGGTVNGSSFIRIGNGVNTTGSVVITSGTISTLTETFTLGYNTGSLGTLNMSGGTINSKYFRFGELAGASGSAVMSGGSISVSGGTYLGYNGLGNGSMTITGGSLTTALLNINGSGANIDAYLALLGGTVEVTGAFFTIGGDDTMHIEGGTFVWDGERLDGLATMISGGYITWTNGQTMLSQTYDVSWTNGTSILYADYDNINAGKTTLWASPIPEPATGLFMLSGGLAVIFVRSRFLL